MDDDPSQTSETLSLPFFEFTIKSQIYSPLTKKTNPDNLIYSLLIGGVLAHSWPANEGKEWDLNARNTVMRQT